jgi:sugar O-acyltransferase (sialic acid O-acetyltransferase NeuD family)
MQRPFLPLWLIYPVPLFMKSKDIVLLGGGGHCKSCIDVIEQHGEYRIVGILDKADKVGDKILNTAIIGIDDDITTLKSKIKYFFVTVGQIRSAELRIFLYNLLVRHGVELPIIISPNAYVSPHSQIGRGTIVMHNVIINADAKVGENCIVNSRALIEHDVFIGNHCHISTGAVVNGGVEIREGTFIGSGAVIVQEAKISANSFIKANSLFIR